MEVELDVLYKGLVGHCRLRRREEGRTNRSGGGTPDKAPKTCSKPATKLQQSCSKAAANLQQSCSKAADGEVTGSRKQQPGCTFLTK